MAGEERDLTNRDDSRPFRGTAATQQIVQKSLLITLRIAVSDITPAFHMRFFLSRHLRV